MKIYVDMDGVLTDFEGQLADLLGISRKAAKGYKSSSMWKKVEDAGESFWSTMEWMPGGKELWDFVKDYNPTILSSPIRHKSSHSGKREWVKKHLGDFPVILDSEKYTHAKPGDILIDDLSKNIDPWNDHKGVGILHKDAKSTISVLKKLLSDEKKGNLPEQIDKVASLLESKGLLKEAYELDVVSNTLEAFQTFKNRPVVIDPYDAMVQKAVQALGPVLSDVDVIKLETSCAGNKLAWVSNQDLIKGAPGKQRVIHLCLNKIKDNFKKQHGNSFTLSSPKEQQQMQQTIIQFLKDVVLPHETEHIHQEMEHGGTFGTNPEQGAEHAENWKAIEDMGYKKR